MTDPIDAVLAELRPIVAAQREEMMSVLVGSGFDPLRYTITTTIQPMPTRGAHLRVCVTTSFKEKEEAG